MMRNDKTHVHKDGQRLGPPPFAKTAIVILIGFSLIWLLRPVKNSAQGRIHEAVFGYKIKNKSIEQAENDKRLPREIRQRRRRLDALLGKDNDAVIKDCEQYIEDNPGSMHAYIFRSLLAAALYRKGEYEKTFAQLKIIESENLPANYIPWVKIMYAYLYEKTGEKQKAIRYLKDIILNHPEYARTAQAKEMLERIEKTGSPEGY
ncbi:MAG: hypothetical protein PHV55_08770 [Candidatus Omnitrophica bacterium]|nr:hypothetical protein [Candidatus Omnitrophota bacterium]